MNKNKPNGVPAYRVETLNPERGITASMKVSKDQRDYTVCLCLPQVRRYKTTVFHSYNKALEQMQKYRQLYKALKPSKQI